MATARLRRWVDLIAALLRRRYPVTLEELRAEVPGYQRSPSPTALHRAFERDKDELRAFGIPIRTVEADGDIGYALSPKEFYLPYLALVAEGGTARPRRVGRSGYRALEELAFEPDELEAVVEAARRVAALGDPALAEDARSALRKLAVDLPVDLSLDAEVRVAASGDAERRIFDALNDALTRRKRITFRYRSMSASGAERERAVEPLGLFFLSQHWYLAARDPDDGVIKNFRVSRIADPVVNATRPGTPDFERPAGFTLPEHARSRQAWELGSGDVVEAVILFEGEGGAVQAAARLGSPVPGRERERRFEVRRLDAFARWLLSLGTGVRPLAPPALVEEHLRQVRETAALYEAAR